MVRLVIIASVVLLVGGLSVFALRGWTRPSANRDTPAVRTASDDSLRDVLIPASDALPAPDLQDGDWINSDKLSIHELKGRVVLVDFWTYGCYNCRNALPAVKRWDDRYRDRGLTIIGVHTPEFDEEKGLDGVRDQVRSLGIRYAVLTDNQNKTWSAYHVRAWPTVFILDKQGRIRWRHVGEGLYEEQENVIKALLAE